MGGAGGGKGPAAECGGAAAEGEKGDKETRRRWARVIGRVYQVIPWCAEVREHDEGGGVHRGASRRRYPTHPAVVRAVARPAAAGPPQASAERLGGVNRRTPRGSRLIPIFRSISGGRSRPNN